MFSSPKPSLDSYFLGMCPASSSTDNDITESSNKALFPTFMKMTGKLHMTKYFEDSRVEHQGQIAFPAYWFVSFFQGTSRVGGVDYQNDEHRSFSQLVLKTIIDVKYKPQTWAEVQFMTTYVFPTIVKGLSIGYFSAKASGGRGLGSKNKVPPSPAQMSPLMDEDEFDNVDRSKRGKFE